MENYIFGSETGSGYGVACEQALRGALAAGREKDGKLETKSLEFDYLHRKSRCEMLIGGDDISNDVITLFSGLVSASCWLVEIWQLSQRRDTGELKLEFKVQRRCCKLSFLFPPRRQGHRRACSQARHGEPGGTPPTKNSQEFSPPPLPRAKLLPVSRFYPSHLGCLLLATS